MELTSCFYVRNLRTCVEEQLSGCTWSPEVARSEPSAPGALCRRGALRPWRPWRPRHRACQRSARRRSRGSPSCTGPWGCTRPPRGRTSRTLCAASRARFCRWDCPLWARSSPPRSAAAFRNSSSPLLGQNKRGEAKQRLTSPSVGLNDFQSFTG